MPNSISHQNCTSMRAMAKTEREGKRKKERAVARILICVFIKFVQTNTESSSGSWNVVQRVGVGVVRAGNIFATLLFTFSSRICVYVCVTHVTCYVCVCVC